jgi:hypothetical protein
MEATAKFVVYVTELLKLKSKISAMGELINPYVSSCGHSYCCPL